MRTGVLAGRQTIDYSLKRFRTGRQGRLDTGGERRQARGVESSVEGGWARLHVRAETDEALHVLPRVFGISSFSRVDVETRSVLESIVGEGEAAFADAVAGKTFAIRARRAGRHPFSSRDVMVELGDALLPHSAGVDLDDPAHCPQCEAEWKGKSV